MLAERVATQQVEGGEVADTQQQRRLGLRQKRVQTEAHWSWMEAR